MDDPGVTLVSGRAFVPALIEDDGLHAVEVVRFFQPKHQNGCLACDGDLHFVRHAEPRPADPVLLCHQDLHDLLDGRSPSRTEMLVVPDVVVQVRAPAVRKRLREQLPPSLVSDPREDHGCRTPRHLSNRPPLMSIVAPVINPATGLATKAITRAISSGSAKRPVSRFFWA